MNKGVHKKKPSDRTRKSLVDLAGKLDIRIPREVRILIEKEDDGYSGTVWGIDGVVVGQGKTEEAALLETVSALKFHFETFGKVKESSTNKNS